MPGSGKTTAVLAAEEMGGIRITMGDVVREEVAKRGLEPSRENMMKLMFEMRTEGGSGIIAQKCMEKIQNAVGKVFIIDGLRCQKEVDIFRSAFQDFLVVLIHTRPSIRYQRLSTRGRSDDPKNEMEFDERDQKEISIGVAQVIALADEVIINEGTIRDLQNNLKKLLREFLASD